MNGPSNTRLLTAWIKQKLKTMKCCFHELKWSITIKTSLIQFLQKISRQKPCLGKAGLPSLINKQFDPARATINGPATISLKVNMTKGPAL